MNWDDAFLLTLFGVPWLWNQITTKPWRKEPPSEDECRCGHASVFHDSSGCRKMVTRPVKWDEDGEECKWVEAECECLRYVGPHSTYIPELDGLPEPKELN